jgi:hypothetical protein
VARNTAEACRSQVSTFGKANHKQGRKQFRPFFIANAARRRSEEFLGNLFELLALTGLIGRQSRGMPIESGDDPQLEPFVSKGREIFTRRQGST